MYVAENGGVAEIGGGGESKSEMLLYSG